MLFIKINTVINEIAGGATGRWANEKKTNTFRLKNVIDAHKNRLIGRTEHIEQ